MSHTTGPDNPGAGKPPAPPRAKTVLVVDDDVLIRRLLHRLLVRQSYTVLTAADGQAGLTLARATRPDLILSNYDMPWMDGPTLLRQLRADSQTAHIPVVLITGALEPHQVEGFDAVIHKPFDIPALLEQIRQHLG